MPQIKQYLTPKQKSLVVNLDPNIYGTLRKLVQDKKQCAIFFRAGGCLEL